jgi:hypothetical protein
VYTYTYYGGPWNGECWYILGIGQLKYLRPFGIHMYVAVIWYILPILVYCTKKNLATLLVSFHFSHLMSIPEARFKGDHIGRLFSLGSFGILQK